MGFSATAARFPASVIVAASIAVSGCGGGDGSNGSAAAPPPEECLASWNAAPESLTFGKHAYALHDARQAEVSELEPGRGAVNIRQEQTCAVIFSVPPTDQEYGDVGLAKTRFGWASMRELERGDAERLGVIQDSAAEQPNVSVFPDGTIVER